MTHTFWVTHLKKCVPHHKILSECWAKAVFPSRWCLGRVWGKGLSGFVCPWLLSYSQWLTLSLKPRRAGFQLSICCAGSCTSGRLLAGRATALSGSDLSLGSQAHLSCFSALTNRHRDCPHYSSLCLQMKIRIMCTFLEDVFILLFYFLFI